MWPCDSWPQASLGKELQALSPIQEPLPLWGMGSPNRLRLCTMGWGQGMRQRLPTGRGLAGGSPGPGLTDGSPGDKWGQGAAEPGVSGGEVFEKAER